MIIGFKATDVQILKYLIGLFVKCRIVILVLFWRFQVVSVRAVVHWNVILC